MKRWLFIFFWVLSGTFVCVVEANENCFLNSENGQKYSQTIEYQGLGITTNVWKLSQRRLELTGINNDEVSISSYKKLIASYQHNVLEEGLFYNVSTLAEDKFKKGFWRLLKAIPMEQKDVDLFLIEVGNVSKVTYMKTLTVVKLSEAELNKAVTVIADISKQVSKICGIEDADN